MNRKLSLLLVFFLLFCLTACNSPSKSKEKSSLPTFKSKIAVKEKEDGWLYYFDYEYVNNKDGSTDRSYAYSGYNLKYKHIDGYVIPITDSKTGKVIGTSLPSLPYLLLNKTLKPDILAIDDFFTKKQFESPISLSDLDGLSLQNIKKEDVLNLFNEAIGGEVIAFGKFLDLPEADIVQEKPLNGYQWQVGFYNAAGNIVKVRIELIYDESTYLSDLIGTDKENKAKKDIYEKVKEIESKIINEQSFVVNGVEDLTIDNIQFKRLYALLQKIQSGGYQR